MTINIISEKEEGNFETDDNPTNAINGKGSNVNVHFNPESNPDIPTLNRKQVELVIKRDLPKLD